MNFALLSLALATVFSPLQGHFESVYFGAEADGVARVSRDEAGDFYHIDFSEDFTVRDSVVLDVKLCGTVSDIDFEVCVNVGELKSLRGAQTYRSRAKLDHLTRVKIFDVDLVQEHAQAWLKEY